MTLRVTVALATPRRQEVVALRLPEGSTVADALARPEAARLVEALGLVGAPAGIWSRPCARETPLRDGDRVELYRALRAEPRQARRERARVRPSNRSRSGP